MAESTKRRVSNVVVTLVGILVAFVMIFPII